MGDTHDAELHIVVIGPMGAGKSTLGRLLADALACDFLDSDVWLKELHGESGSAIAVTHGLARLHAIELEVFEVMASTTPRAVIAAAESVVDTDIGQRLLSANVTIWVDAAPDVLIERRTDADHRRAMSEAELIERRASRHEALRRCSTIHIDTSAAPPEECLVAALEAMGRA